MAERNVVNFKIHNLTEEQFQELKEQGKIDPNALYFTPDKTKVKIAELEQSVAGLRDSKADQTAVDTLTGEVSDLMADVSAVEADVMGKVAIAQGTENAGKILKVDDEGNTSASFANELKMLITKYAWEESTTGYVFYTFSENPKVGDAVDSGEDITEVGNNYIVIAGSSKRYERNSSLDTQETENIDFIKSFTEKASRDLENITRSACEKMAAFSMPSDTYEDVPLGETWSSYTAPADGYFALHKESGATGETIRMINTSASIASTVTAPGAGFGLYTYVPASKGDAIQIGFTTTGATKKFIFVYANGAK